MHIHTYNYLYKCTYIHLYYIYTCTHTYIDATCSACIIVLDNQFHALLQPQHSLGAWNSLYAFGPYGLPPTRINKSIQLSLAFHILYWWNFRVVASDVSVSRTRSHSKLLDPLIASVLSLSLVLTEPSVPQCFTDVSTGTGILNDSSVLNTFHLLRNVLDEEW